MTDAPKLPCALGKRGVILSSDKGMGGSSRDYGRQSALMCAGWPPKLGHPGPAAPLFSARDGPVRPLSLSLAQLRSQDHAPKRIPGACGKECARWIPAGMAPHRPGLYAGGGRSAAFRQRPAFSPGNLGTSRWRKGQETGGLGNHDLAKREPANTACDASCNWVAKSSIGPMTLS